MGVGHENSQQGPLPLHIRNGCHGPLLCHLFLKRGYCGFFLSWAMLKEARQKLEMKCFNLVSVLKAHLN